MIKIGLKIWSTNERYYLPALKLYEEKIFDYIELFAVPDSFTNTIGIWKKMKIPFSVHAPHFSQGLNFAMKDHETSNLKMAEEALMFSEELGAEYTVFHPGVEGDIKETLRQIGKLRGKGIIIENKPYYSVDKQFVCRGYSPEEIDVIMKETGLGFCLDFGHCICSANAQDIEPFAYIMDFLKLRPSLYHLTDGNYKGDTDRHDHFGKGSFPITKIMSLIPGGSRVTNEAEKESPDNLDDFVKDIKYLKSRTLDV